ncbi:HTH-type transcriptional activator RhaS [Edaphovirga cremea]|uniref:HTH-type transcriptional activator RhaS n=1 Tax=Edaphovirga cremea TaxID=2267246 RepID=UPI000DEF656B|nr:HTH-type transcriptional activator RhaS [Edaphovirga cremea]
MYMLRSYDFFPHQQDAVALAFREPQEAFPEHTHDFNEIFIVDGGSGIHVLNDFPYAINCGMFFYISANDRHLFEQVDDLNLVNILYRPNEEFTFIKNFTHLLPKPEEGCVWNISPKLKKELKQMLEDMNRDEEQEPLIEQCRKEMLFLKMLLLLRQGRYRVSHSDSNQDKLQQILLFLQQHALDDINWESLAERFFITPRTLHRQFLNHTGQTPQKYLNHLRLNRAKYQIQSTDQTLTEIAFACGFSDSNNFSTSFKKAFGVSPSHMRKSMQFN